jgi:dienelactone hydrolase
MWKRSKDPKSPQEKKYNTHHKQLSTLNTPPSLSFVHAPTVVLVRYCSLILLVVVKSHSHTDAAATTTTTADCHSCMSHDLEASSWSSSTTGSGKGIKLRGGKRLLPKSTLEENTATPTALLPSDNHIPSLLKSSAKNNNKYITYSLVGVALVSLILLYFQSPPSLLHNHQYSNMEKTECCPTHIRPAVNNYTGRGHRVTMHEGLSKPMDMYVIDPTVFTTNAPPLNKRRAIVLIHDIFGWTPHMEQLADRLAEYGGFTVYVPDIMRGDAWPLDNVPPHKEGRFPSEVKQPADGVSVLVQWIQTSRTCHLDQWTAIRAVQEYAQSVGDIDFWGLLGLCWGGKVVMTVAGDHTDAFHAVAACHGAFLNRTDIERVQMPRTNRHRMRRNCNLCYRRVPDPSTRIFLPCIMDGWGRGEWGR